MMLRHVLLNTFAGWLAGTLCSLGGALKDSPEEGFKPVTFPRSMVVATLWGCVSTAVTADFYLAFAFAGYFERLTVEGWKIVRAKRPSKFVAEGCVREWGRARLTGYNLSSQQAAPKRLSVELGAEPEARSGEQQTSYEQLDPARDPQFARGGAGASG